MYTERRGTRLVCIADACAKVCINWGQSCLNFKANKAAKMAVTFDDTVKHALGELQLLRLTLNEQLRVILEHEKESTFDIDTT